MLSTAFDRWLDETFAREGAFTAFLILFEDAPGTIVPIASSYLHILGADTRWDEVAALIGTSGMTWHSVAVFAAKDVGGGAIPDSTARHRLEQLQEAVLRDRLTIQKGDLFDTQGRRLKLELATTH